MVVIRNFRDVEAKPSLEGVTMRVVIGPDQGAPVFNLRVFEVQPGAATPHHAHWWEHEVFVLDGTGVVNTPDGDQPIAAGKAVFVGRKEMHHFKNTGDSVLRFICLVPQEWLEGVPTP
ncbi:cupin domain-containing protein [bacterium]|nr:cupin domain-containing protein [candidate division CSSED10-310 bacterium]